MTIPLEKTLVAEKNGKEFYSVKIPKEDWLLFEKAFLRYYKERQEMKDDLIEAIKDAKEILEGRRKGHTFREFLQELEEEEEKNEDVVISKEDWLAIKKKMEAYEYLEEIRSGIKSSMNEIAEAYAGKRKPKTLKEALDEC